MYKFAITKTATCIAVISLSACGGGGTSSASFSELQQDYFQAITPFSLNSSGIPANPTQLSSVPTSGSKTYSGQMALIVRPTGQAADITLSQTNLQNEGMIGEVNLAVNFASDGGSLSGSATNFVSSDNSDVIGTLTLSSTSLDRINVQPNPEQVSYAATLFSGSLSGTSIGNANLNGVSVGGFADPGAAMWGLALGNSDSATGTNAFKGTFVATEN